MNKYLEPILKTRTAVSVFLVIVLTISIQSLVRSTAETISINVDSNDVEIEEVFTAFVSIPNGASAATISNILKNASLIDSAITFEIYIRNEGYADRLRAGNYEIESGLSYESLVNVLLIGPPLKTYEITIVEGLWLKEIIESISIQTGYDYVSLVNTLTSGSVTSAYLESNEYSKLNNWEGLLFPDTYKFSVDADGTEIFQTLANQLELVMLSIKNSRNVPDWTTSDYEIFIVASLVETEALLDEDRPLVSSVIRNRIEDGMPLQIDATVLYSLGERKTQVLLKDLQVDSEYNTYKYIGLPPTPISNFGKASLEAVFENLETSFIYYLLTNKNGDMTFTDDYNEFLDLKSKAKDEGVIP